MIEQLRLFLISQDETSVTISWDTDGWCCHILRGRPGIFLLGASDGASSIEEALKQALDEAKENTRG